MRLIIAAALAATALTACSSEPETVAEDAPAYSARQYSSAINDIARTEEDRAADANRQPGELLAFAQIDKGEVVGDYFMGGGYVTRLLAMAVGSNGKVYAFQPEEFIAMYPTLAEDQDDAVAPYADDQGNPTRVFPLRGPAAEPGFPEPLDAIITVMNYHDLFLPSFPEGTAEAASQALFDALRPGGVLIVAWLADGERPIPLRGRGGGQRPPHGQRAGAGDAGGRRVRARRRERFIHAARRSARCLGLRREHSRQHGPVPVASSQARILGSGPISHMSRGGDHAG